jgi:fructuronate reductase
VTGLGLRSLGRLAAGVQRPRYDPSQVRIGVVHFGPGAFHRAHQGDYFDRLLESNPRWGISAVSLRSAGTVQALRAQDGLYSLSILDRDPALRVLAPHREWIGPGQEQRLKSRLVDPEVRLVTATVTEKGYCLGGNSRLDFSHPDVVHDLRYPADPRSFPGWLVAGLAARRAARLPAFTTLSCDNLGQNGRKLGGAVIALAEARDQDLARWIADETRFPNTMVDSITPASDAAFLDQLQYRLGVRDDAAVKREAFAQWVIERANGAELPDLGSVGATLTQDVAAWERAKLRILNGTHSTLAYLGLLRGHRTVDEAVQDRDLAGFVEAMVREEVWPGLARTEGLDLSAYTADVFSRFRNPAIGHQLSQIAWDGSQKLPYRLLAGIAEAIAAGRPYVRLATGVAAWMAFCTVRARHGEPITDPLADRLVEAGRVANERSSAEPFLTFTEVFSAELSAHEPFREVVNQSFRSLASASTAPLSISSLAK